MTIAMRTFNALDFDGNGYLDREETKDSSVRPRAVRPDRRRRRRQDLRRGNEGVHPRPRRAGRDDLPGHGIRRRRRLFSALDSNGDRRISMREMRYADRRSSRWRRDREPGSPDRSRCGAIASSSSAACSIRSGLPRRWAGAVATDCRRETAPVGPDLVSALGPQQRRRHHLAGVPRPARRLRALDVDRDGLIDPKEAEAAGKIPRDAQPPDRTSPPAILDAVRAEPFESSLKMTGQHEVSNAPLNDDAPRSPVSGKPGHGCEDEVGKVVVGQNEIIESLLIGLLAAGTSCCTACRGWARR